MDEQKNYIKSEQFINKILLVDDDISVLKLISFILLKEKYDVIGTINNGKDAINIYKNIWENVDLIILDLYMPPGINGIQVLEILLNINPNAKIIICSSIEDINIINQAKMRGAKDYITKPINKDKLIQIIENIQNI
ncbi:MAG: response regulator [Bacteroidales bacterium]|nr:response regulator [Bacteroidales bacterium]